MRATIALCILLFPSVVWAARLSIVVDDSAPAYQRVIQAVQKECGSGNNIEVYNIGTVDLANPVAKGRFLARVAAADLIVPIGDGASRLISQELTDLRTFFISAAALSGSYLAEQHVAGILSYSPEETVGVAKALLPDLKIIGVLYTPGYEAVVARMNSAARRNDISLNSQRINSRKEIGAAAHRISSRSDLLWVVGDPLLAHDLVFGYLLHDTLSMKKPVAAPLPALVKKGGLFCTIPDHEKMARLASSTLARFLGQEAGFSSELRIQPAPDDGFVMINRQVADKLNIRIPSSLRLWEGKGL